MKDILFYQANFEPEVFRMLDAKDKGEIKHFLFFKNKTMKIVRETLNLSKSFPEKEEWQAIYNLVEDSEFIDIEQESILKKIRQSFLCKIRK